MQIAVNNAVPGIDGDCGGEAACGTCHVIVAPEWSDTVGPRRQRRGDARDEPERQPTSRLSCQMAASEAWDGMTVELPEFQPGNNVMDLEETIMSIPAAVAAKAQSAVPLSCKLRRTPLRQDTSVGNRTNGKKIFTETPIPPVEDVDIADIDLSNPFLYRQGRWKSY